MTARTSRLNIIIPVIMSLAIIALTYQTILQSRDYVIFLSISILLVLFIVGAAYTRAGIYVAFVFLLFIISAVYLQNQSQSGSDLVTATFVTIYIGMMALITWLFVIFNKSFTETARTVRTIKGSRSQERELFDVINDLEFLETP
ncbi:MAG: hypothetical protein M1597_00900 [Candidatus Thermoplasmatota archaeon]|nr:hypothetical protein [Candidatus Thermoplasmatota archaeon]